MTFFYVLHRRLCKPSRFIEECQNIHQCCGNEGDSNLYIEMYKARLAFWKAKTKTYEPQDRRMLEDMNMYFNAKTSEVSLMLESWPVCESCYCRGLGVSTKRWVKLKQNWEQSGRKLKRWVSRHGLRIRRSPVQDFFRQYLQRLADVTSRFIFLLF